MCGLYLDFELKKGSGKSIYMIFTKIIGNLNIDYMLISWNFC